MATFIEELVDYIASEASLTEDVNIFLGANIVDAPNGSVVIKELPGGYVTDSGIIVQPMQVLVRYSDLVNAEDLIYTVHKALRNKAGFGSVTNVFYCEVLIYPSLIMRSTDGGFIMSANYLFHRM